MTEAERERAAVVAWIRKWTPPRPIFPSPSNRDPNLRDWWWTATKHSVMTSVADMIERGAHLKDPHP